jgi:uncharacterized protein (DUF302 family)
MICRACTDWLVESCQPAPAGTEVTFRANTPNPARTTSQMRRTYPRGYIEINEPGTERGTHVSYGTSITVCAPFTETVARVREVLAGQGFGVLTEIDVTATMRVRLGEEMEDYVILGACSPPFAHRALGIDRGIGLLLPCNIVVRAAADGTIVEALDPQVMVTLTGRPELKPVADEVARRLTSALAELTPTVA